MSYEINVSKDGKHFFATHERSARWTSEATEITKVFVEKFPASEGYKINVTYKQEIGHCTNIKSTQDVYEQISQL